LPIRIRFPPICLVPDPLFLHTESSPRFLHFYRGRATWGSPCVRPSPHAVATVPSCFRLDVLTRRLPDDRFSIRYDPVCPVSCVEREQSCPHQFRLSAIKSFFRLNPPPHRHTLSPGCFRRCVPLPCLRIHTAAEARDQWLSADGNPAPSCSFLAARLCQLSVGRTPWFPRPPVQDPSYFFYIDVSFVPDRRSLPLAYRGPPCCLLT